MAQLSARCWTSVLVDRAATAQKVNAWSKPIAAPRMYVTVAPLAARPNNQRTGASAGTNTSLALLHIEQLAQAPEATDKHSRGLGERHGTGQIVSGNGNGG